ncbi:MAG: CCA tRNA nucleotidyltransferase [Planctomycetales bacterium]|nr:CCA tRNA nucleotidyltransferase [Planctomycetales bacterium]
MAHSDKAAQARISQDPRAALALQVIQELNKAGFLGYLAGGCVRDALLERTPKDYDVATNARPEQIRDLFGRKRTLAIGAAFGVISVLPTTAGSAEPVEVATFRSDGAYTDGRRPDSVHFSSPELDAHRRDFTINGMFLDPLRGEVIDFVGGRDDLAHGFIRAIGDPVARFTEDKLRLLRAARFATTYNFAIEQQTMAAIVSHAADVMVCSGERIGAEMRRLISSPYAARGLMLLRESRLAEHLMPGVAAAWRDDVKFQYAQRLLSNLAPEFAVRLAGIGHSVGDNDAVGDNTFGESAGSVLKELGERWRLANDELHAAQQALDFLPSLRRASELPWSRLQPLLIARYRDTAVELARGVLVITGGEFTDAWKRIAAELSRSAEDLNPPPLLTGDDLIRMGMRPGPNFRELLAKLRDSQLDGEIATVAEAVEIARRNFT